jgi:hypothetical protein
LRRANEDIASLRIVRHIGSLRKISVSVLHHDNRRINEDANGKREPAERHDVGADVQEVHRDERRQHGNG